MSSSADEIVERATELRQRALTAPKEVEPSAVAEIIATPTAPPSAHGAVIVALRNVARVRDDVGAEFVADLVRLLDRPSLETAVVLRCLRQLAMNDPQAVLEFRDEIMAQVSTDNTAVTQAATGCCVELVAPEPVSFVDLVPTLAALLDSENEQIRKNAVYILSQIAHEYPEEVKPVVPQLLEGIHDRDRTYQTNALSALGAIVSAYPAAGTAVTAPLVEIVSSDASSKVRANAIGLLGDIAAEYPAELEDHVPLLVDCLQTDDEYIAGNATAALLHVAVDNDTAAETAIPGLIELLDDPSPVVRRNVCKALGHLEATVALEQLTSLSNADPDERVRRVAAWSVDQVTQLETQLFRGQNTHVLTHVVSSEISPSRLDGGRSKITMTATRAAFSHGQFDPRPGTTRGDLHFQPSSFETAESFHDANGLCSLTTVSSRRTR